MDSAGSWEYCEIGAREVTDVVNMDAERQWTATVIGPKWRIQIAASPPYTGRGEAELAVMVKNLANSGWEAMPADPDGIPRLLRRV